MFKRRKKISTCDTEHKLQLFTDALKIAVKVAQEIKTFVNYGSTFFLSVSILLPFRRHFVSGSSITIYDPYGIDVPA